MGRHVATVARSTLGYYITTTATIGCMLGVVAEKQANQSKWAMLLPIYKANETEGDVMLTLRRRHALVPAGDDVQLKRGDNENCFFVSSSGSQSPGELVLLRLTFFRWKRSQTAQRRGRGDR